MVADRQEAPLSNPMELHDLRSMKNIKIQILPNFTRPLQHLTFVRLFF